MTNRPSVSVIVPFLGSDTDLAGVVERLLTLSIQAGDELIVADNRPGAAEPAATSAEGGSLAGVIIQPAGAVTSPGFARNRAAVCAAGEWLVFIDADTEPDPNLIGAYFDPLPSDQTAILGGGIIDTPPPGVASVAAAHAVARAQMADRVTLSRPRFPYAQTANCAIRRAVLLEAGGFAEDVRAGEDADLCLRLVAAGWELQRRPAAVVRHRARATFKGSMRQLARHGSGAAWCNHRHPGSFPAPTPASFARRLIRSGLTAASQLIRGERDQATFAALEIAEAVAFELGRLTPNGVRRPLPKSPEEWRRTHRQI
jgi:mycofactocin glycosyltransferase